MIQTDFNREEYERIRIEDHKAEGLHFVPEGTEPKKYVVTCENGSDWDEIHDYIINENEIDGIPNRKIECTDDCKSCDRMATYEMSDEEAEQLKLHPKVFGVNLDPDYYQGTFKGSVDRIHSVTNRYGTNVKIGRDFTSAFFPTTPDSSFLSRTGASIYRHQQKDDPWNGSADTTIINADPQYRGDGTDVDIIVCDQAAWYGHIEFLKTGTGEPTNFVGENVLKSGFSSSSATGVCGVLDCVLDSPYYLDPDFFEANVGTALTTRWDGTKVPTDTAAQNWWNNNSTTYRSAKYVSSGNGGTATGDNDFGTVTVSSNYTRARCNGSNTAYHTQNNLAYHATPCMAQAYGKTHGWAFNSNKWHMNILWGTGSLSVASCFKILKIFHQCKPNRSSDNTKNPTITSHSWGRYSTFSSGYYYFRTAGDGTGGVSFTSGTKPEFLDNLYYSGEYGAHVNPSYSESVLGKDLVDAGVIFLGASGNWNQKMVLDGHADYNNYQSSSSNMTLASAEAIVGGSGQTSMTNRVSFPVDIGNITVDGKTVHRCFNIGNLDSNKVSNTQERIEESSCMGNAIDCYAIGQQSLAACDDNTNVGNRRNRYDGYYTIGGQQSVESEDAEFGGTSSACPVTAGMFATKLQYNRTWTWSNLKDWLANHVTDQSATAMYTGSESTTANDSNWSDDRSLEGGSRKILWDASTPAAILNLMMKGRLSMYLSGYSGNSTLSFGTTPLFAPIVKRTAQVSTNGLTFRVDASNPSSYSGSGTAWNDLSGNNHNATLVNGPTYTTDDQGAIVFDGVNDYVNVSDTSVLPSGTNSFTYTIWVYIDTVSGNFGGTKKGAILLSGNTDGTVEIGLFTTSNTAGPPEQFRMSRYGGGNTGTCAATVSMNTSAWYNLTLVKDGASSQVIYQDGVQIGTGNHSNSFQGGYASKIAGAPSQSSYSGHLDGRIAEVAMYNRALSSAEVMEFYLATKDNHTGGAGGGEGP